MTKFNLALAVLAVCSGPVFAQDAAVPIVIDHKGFATDMIIVASNKKADALKAWATADNAYVLAATTMGYAEERLAAYYDYLYLMCTPEEWRGIWNDMYAAYNYGSYGNTMYDDAMDSFPTADESRRVGVERYALEQWDGSAGSSADAEMRFMNSKVDFEISTTAYNDTIRRANWINAVINKYVPIP